MSITDIGFVEKDREKAIKYFLQNFGKGGEWFYRVIKVVREKIEGGANITDLLIREESVPLVGVLKNFFILDDLMEIKVSRDEIREFVKTALEYSDRGFDYCELSVGRKKSVDFSFAIYGFGIFRVNYSRDMNGDVLNIRYLDFVLPELSDMQFPEVYEKFLESEILGVRKFSILSGSDSIVSKVIRSGGLILHSGETGSGKTTSIAAEIKYFAEETNGLIITYENPVEYRFLSDVYPTVRQLEIGKHLDQDEIYYHFLRNSPMVGMIGEIRRQDEYFHVLDLATRGHLIITTLHARNAIDTVMSFLGVIGHDKKDILLSTLKAVISHKLYLNQKGNIIPFYEVLIFNDVVRSIFMKETNYQKLLNYFYVDQKNLLLKEGVFYTFEDCIKERYTEKKMTPEEYKTLSKSL